MHLALALLLCLTATGPGTDRKTEPGTITPPPRTWRSLEALRPAEVLVVRGTRQEQDRVVLETEEILAGAKAAEGFEVVVRSPSETTWEIMEPSIAQYLVGVQLTQWAPATRKLTLAFAPLPGANARRYTMQWNARVERWETVRQRHPDLPVPSASGWRVRFVRYAGTDSTGATASRRR